MSIDTTLAGLTLLALPLVAYLIQAWGGARLSSDGDWVGALALGGTVAGATLLALLTWRQGPEAPWSLEITGWATDPAGRPLLQVGLLVDQLSLTLVLLVAAVSFLVYLAARRSLQGHAARARLLAHHCLATGAALTVILSSSLLVLLAAWVVLSAATFVLVGARGEVADAASGGLRATRVLLALLPGDLCLLAFLLLTHGVTGSLDLHTVHLAIEAGLWPPGLQLAGALLLVTAVLCRCAQVPFHVWARSAGEAPSLAGAFLPAVALGGTAVYLLLRLHPLLGWPPEAPHGDRSWPVASLVLAILAAGSALLGAGMALVQTRLRSVLACSTVTELGLVLVSVALGQPALALVHLAAHGALKAALVSGVSLPARRPGAGGLLSAVVLLLAMLALAGIPPFAPFHTRRAILLLTLEAGAAPGLPLAALPAAMVALALPLSALALLVGFLRAGRDAVPEAGIAPERARRAPIPPALPVLLLTVAGAGLCGLQGDLLARLRELLEPASPGAALPEVAPAVAAGLQVLSLLLPLLGLAVVLPWAWTVTIGPLADRSRFGGPWRRALSGGLHLEEVAWSGLPRVVRRSSLLARWSDRALLDWLVELWGRVTLTAAWLLRWSEARLSDLPGRAVTRLALLVGRGFRRMQTGKVQDHMALACLACVLFVIFWLVVSSLQLRS